MSSQESGPLREKLEKVEQRLEAALGEVCEDPSLAGVRKPNTGELIRIDETLALASEAAKQAIALRRRLHTDAKDDAAKTSPKEREDRLDGPPRAQQPVE